MTLPNMNLCCPLEYRRIRLIVAHNIFHHVIHVISIYQCIAFTRAMRPCAYSITSTHTDEWSTLIWGHSLLHSCQLNENSIQ